MRNKTKNEKIAALETEELRFPGHFPEQALDETEERST
jgi:hypothetical protein